MKFGAKILFGNLMIVIFLFAVGGGLLVWNNYKRMLDGNVESCVDENELLCSMLEISILRQASAMASDDRALVLAGAADMSYGISG